MSAEPELPRPASTEDAAASSAFSLLHSKLQRWIWQQGWNELRDIQEQAIPALIGAQQDVLICAPTAQGKTEAAFLPILSRLAEPAERPAGFGALYVSPLRALINDQFRRLDGLCESLELPVFRWHGDVSAATKRQARTRPAGGIVLITPESLEALLVRRGLEVPALVHGLSHIVIDELHSFFGTERGRQLQSLLHRIDLAAGRAVSRVGLSATLADLRMAANFLRIGAGEKVALLESRNVQQLLQLQLRGYVSQTETSEEQALDHARQIGRHLFQHLRGTRNLVFANSRRNVETFTSTLADLSEKAGVPNEFLPHHGSLSAELRDEAETRMRDGQLPTSVICTTTLELGIDIGDIDSVAQIGPPPSVSALRQRLGRSGRRAGRPATMRMYVAEMQSTNQLLGGLCCEIVQSIAGIELLLQKWNEPLNGNALHLSTLVHQLLALIAQHGGIQPGQAYDVLCQKGPFRSIAAASFKMLLRHLATPEVRLIEQSPDGMLLLGEVGEQLVDSYQFYAVFQTPTEYRVIHGTRPLGTISRDNPLWPGSLILLGGRRWSVSDVDERSHTLFVTPAFGGNPPRFSEGSGPTLSDRLVAQMRETYQQLGVPKYLNAAAIQLLADGRQHYSRLGLRDASAVCDGAKWFLFPWAGTVVLTTLVLDLKRRGVEVVDEGIAISVDVKNAEIVRSALAGAAGEPPPSGETLAAKLLDLCREKFDAYLSPDLLRQSTASAYLQPERLPNVARELLAGWPVSG